jgi:hypothetical protein
MIDAPQLAMDERPFCPEPLTPPTNRVFVFGSNLAGRHGAGAARYAFLHHGAVYGVGVGRQGNSYAIPTKDQRIATMQLGRIAGYVASFLDYARSRPHEIFQVTAIGTGLAGYSPEDIAPMFVNAPANCDLPEEFGPIVARLRGIVA